MTLSAHHRTDGSLRIRIAELARRGCDASDIALCLNIPRAKVAHIADEEPRIHLPGRYAPHKKKGGA